MNKLEHDLRVRLLALQRRVRDLTAREPPRPAPSSAVEGSRRSAVNLCTFSGLPSASLSPSQGVGVYVLGMHRSGTSAATRAINLLGVPVNSPHDWLAPRAQNPKGYWESASLVAVNDQLLALLGCDCWCPPLLPSGWERDQRLHAFREHAGSAFHAVFRTPQWVWKDPRTVVTFPFWVDVVGARPVVVLVYRNPLEVSCSLAVAMADSDPLPKWHRLALWERYVRMTFASVVGLPVLITNYEDLLEDTSTWCEGMRSFLASHGVMLDDDYSLTAISAFLERKLRHNNFTLSDLRSDPDISDEQARLYSILEGSRGIHASLELPELPPETSWTEPVLTARRRVFLSSGVEAGPLISPGRPPLPYESTSEGSVEHHWPRERLPQRGLGRLR